MPLPPGQAACPKCGACPGDDVDPAAARTLGGYEVVRLLGKGGMGMVFLARQVSLDRPVALKVMHARLARNAAFLARFTREAFAAAQLVHHNIVQIYDIGQDKGIHFFSMEYVRGTNLAELVRRDGRLEVEQAAGYILQAARGLKFAHDRGMVHRDVKPDNLLLNESGVVKVADLGLVKLVGADDPQFEGPAVASPDLTAANATVGTAAFMAPEQARGSAVDHRADIYSLGCTFYVLLTGQPPFRGETSMEVLTQHCCEPVVPPEVHSPRVPRELSALVLRMLAKKPEDRYATLDPVIGELEHFLGPQAGGPFSPRQEHLDKLASCVRDFQSPTAHVRRQMHLGFHGICGLVALFCLLVGAVRVSLFVAALAVLTAVVSFLLRGIVYRTPLFCKLRELLFESSWKDRLIALGAVLCAAAVVLAIARPAGAVAMLVLAVGWGLSLHILLDRRVQRERERPLDQAEHLLRSLRLRGVDEEALRRFVCKYAGDQWEEFFEALFGYDHLIEARLLSVPGTDGRRRPRFAPWRDPVIRWIDARLRARRALRDQELLALVGRQDLEARGVASPDARQQAEQAAQDLVLQASPAPQEHIVPVPTVQPEPPPPLRVIAVTPQPGPPPPPVPLRKRLAILVKVTVGVGPRAIAALLLLGLCGLWINQNHLLPAWLLEDPTRWNELDVSKTRPLDLRFIPETWLRPFNSLNPGVAGLVLLLSLFRQGWRMNLFLLPAAAVILLGETFGMPAWDAPWVGTLPPHRVSLVVGLALLLPGLLFDHFGTPSPP
jgi:hypothetical protein